MTVWKRPLSRRAVTSDSVEVRHVGVDYRLGTLGKEIVVSAVHGKGACEVGRVEAAFDPVSCEYVEHLVRSGDPVVGFDRIGYLCLNVRVVERIRLGAVDGIWCCIEV